MSIYTPREMIDKLISFDTTSFKSNLNLIHFVRDYLADHGVESHLVMNEEGTKANLYATVGPNIEGGIVLSGHTDVVPVKGQPWDTDPFTVVEKDGKLYGRGTCDMKSFFAMGLALVPEMLERGLKQPVIFALSYDEEIGCMGAPFMIEEIVRDLPKPRAVIVGEPTSMEVVTAHKGMMHCEVRVTGREAHSSLIENGVSAVMTSARLITFIEDMMKENKAHANADSPFVPPYTTCHVGVIHGGTADNIISRECSFSVDIRTIPEDHGPDFLARIRTYADELLVDMRKIAPEADIEVIQGTFTPGLKPEIDGEAERICRHITGDNGTHVVSYGTEAGQFQGVGFSVVVCGPGSIDQAHRPNEYISLDQVAEGEKFLRKLVDIVAV